MISPIGEYRIESRNEIRFELINALPEAVEEERDFLQELTLAQRIVKEKIQTAIDEERYADLAPLYDELLSLEIEAVKERHKQSGFPFPLADEIILLHESLIAQAKSFYLILSGQPDKAIEACTPIIQRIQSLQAGGVYFIDGKLLQIRAAAYLMSGARELGLQDLKDSNNIANPYGDNPSFGFDNVWNTVFLKTIEQKLGAHLVEIRTVSPDEWNKMTDQEKADYFLMNHSPLEALEFVGNCKERRAIALAQLGRFDEAIQVFDDPLDYSETVALIYFMQGDLQNAKEMAEYYGVDTNVFSFLLMISYLESSHL